MRSALMLLMVLLLAVIVGCEQRELGRADVVGAADDLQRRQGWEWGSPVDVLPPDAATAHGEHWWQVRYANDANGAARVILVAADNAWARLPPPGYVQRVSVPAQVLGTTPAQLPEGPWIVLVTAPAKLAADADAALERDAARLNALAGQTGLYPLFSVRHDHGGRAALVYGWQGDRGVQREQHVIEWLALRTTYRAATWVDLLAGG